MARIATLTMNPSLDVNTSVERVVPDEKLRCEAPTHEAGGGGLNVSRVAARLGEESDAVITAGGPIGRALVELVRDEGLDPTAVEVEDTTRQNPTFSESATDRQYRFVMPGPHLQEDEWNEVLDVVEGLEPDILVASGSLPPGVPDDFYARLARRETALGCKVVVDASGEALRAVAGEGVHLLKPNAAELEALWGAAIDSEEEFEEVADRLVADGAAEVIVLSLGAGGAYLARRDGSSIRLVAPTVRIRSRIGAGDSMVAGIVVGLARGWEVEDAVRHGLAAGAAAVMTEGSELARADDVERLHRRLSSGEGRSASGGR